MGWLSSHGGQAQHHTLLIAQCFPKPCTHPVGCLVHGVGRQVGVALRGGRLVVAEQLAEYRQRQPEGYARTGVCVAEVVQPHLLELGLTTEPRPGLVGIDEGLAMMASWQHIRIVLLTYQAP